jgi:hypothetical protein
MGCRYALAALRLASGLAAGPLLFGCGSDSDTGGGAGGSHAGSPSNGGSPSGAGSAGGPLSNGGSDSSSGGASGAGGKLGSAGAGPLNPGEWAKAASNLTTLNSECGNLSTLASKPDQDLLIAGVAKNGLWSSKDGGASWQAMGTGAGSDPITNRTSAVVFDPVSKDRFWESGIYNGNGVYETSDGGVTFQKQGSATHADLVSVDFSDPDRKTLLAGGHEQSRTLNRSTDGGATWAPIGSGLPDSTNCTLPLVIGALDYLVGCGGYGGGAVGIYRTTNGGTSWAEASKSGGGSRPLVASDASIYWASPNGSLTRSTDHGQTWQDVAGAGSVNSTSPTELPDGRLAALGQNAVVVSADSGKTWQKVTKNLPYNDARGVLYSKYQKAFFIWRFSCGDGPLPDDAVERAAFDYEAN